MSLVCPIIRPTSKNAEEKIKSMMETGEGCWCTMFDKVEVIIPEFKQVSITLKELVELLNEKKIEYTYALKEEFLINQMSYKDPHSTSPLYLKQLLRQNVQLHKMLCGVLNDYYLFQESELEKRRSKRQRYRHNLRDRKNNSEWTLH